MKKTGYVVLPLHSGHAPAWLIKRMMPLADEVVRLIANEYGPSEFLVRLSEPHWFQAFGCVLGFDWHSSGLTTVVTGVLKSALSFEKHGLMMAGGKGRASRRAQPEIEEIGVRCNFPSHQIEESKYASRMCAKVDTAAIQDCHPIYHHAFFLAEKGEWCVVQQGLNVEEGTARRYHWLSKSVKNFVVEPHEAIVGEAEKGMALNMTAKEAEENRRTCVDLVRGEPSKLASSIRACTQDLPLDHWTAGATLSPSYKAFSMPSKLNWGLFRQLYERQPENYEELLAFKGVGPATVRALALVSELVYGRPASWRDPIKYTFAHGGKDGVPYPVNLRVMDESIRMLRETLMAAEFGQREKLGALRRLEGLARLWGL